MSTIISPQFPHSRSDCRRTQCDVLHPEGPGKANLLEPVQTAADGASTLRTVRVTAKNTWLHASAQISRIVRRHFRKHASRRRNRRHSDGVRNPSVHQQFWISLACSQQIAGCRVALCRGQHLRALLASLRRVKAHPHTYDFRPVAPESNIFLKVPRPLQHRPRDCPVNIHPASFYVLQDTFVSGGLAANIMMLGQAVDRNHDPHARNLHPSPWNRKHRRVSEKNGFPGGKQVGDSQSRPAIALIHRTPLIRVATNVGSAMRSQVQAAVYPRVVSIPPGQSSACWRRRMAESAPLPGQHPPRGTRCSTPRGDVAAPGSEETK